MARRLPARITAARKRPGGSNVGRYPGVRTFAGPAGGAPAGSYPLNTLARARSALSYARHAPNPAGIKAAARRAIARFKSRGRR